MRDSREKYKLNLSKYVKIEIYCFIPPLHDPYKKKCLKKGNKTYFNK